MGVLCSKYQEAPESGASPFSRFESWKIQPPQIGQDSGSVGNKSTLDVTETLRLIYFLLFVLL